MDKWGGDTAESKLDSSDLQWIRIHFIEFRENDFSSQLLRV